MNWCVLHVKTGYERHVLYMLNRKLHIKALAPAEEMPVRRGGVWKIQLRLYLPGYVFVAQPTTNEQYYHIRALPGVIRFLGGSSPQVVPQKQMELILAVDALDSAHGGHAIVTRRQDGTHSVTLGVTPVLLPTIRKYNARRKRATIEFSILNDKHIITIPASPEPVARDSLRTPKAGRP